MTVKTEKIYEKYAKSEIGAIRKNWNGNIRVALIYPNRYQAGMANLGFQTVYYLLNQIDHVVCERFFLPEKIKLASNKSFVSIESRKSISEFNIVAFSLSFENDYPNILAILNLCKIPLRFDDRTDSHPLVIAGGVVCFLNPEPIAAFIDCFLIGEAETIFPFFFEVYTPDIAKIKCLKNLAQKVPGIYVPAFYKAFYNSDGTCCSFKPECDVPEKIQRVYVKDLSLFPTCSSILTPYAAFGESYLIEIGRGCVHGCRFCSAGFIYRPPRFRPFPLIMQCIEKGVKQTDKIGLVGSAISDFPEIESIYSRLEQKGVKISFSSFRADMLTSQYVSLLRQGQVKTATIAPDAGSERMRRVINKNLSEEEILRAVDLLVSNDIFNLKLYFMVGLPKESIEDIESIVELCKRIKAVFLNTSRKKNRIGEITVSLNSFVPKPFTPFQWAKMDNLKTLKKKIKIVKQGVKKIANLTCNVDIPRHAYIQGLFARGDRKVANVLCSAQQNAWNWPKTLKALSVDPDFYVTRERLADEVFPWDFIDHGLKKSFLWQEYCNAQKELVSANCPMKSCSLCGVCEKKVT